MKKLLLKIFLILLVAAVGLVGLFFVRIPCTGPVLDFINKKTDNLLPALGVEVKGISVDLRGKVYIASVRGVFPYPFKGDKITLGFSLKDIVDKKLRIRSIYFSWFYLYNEDATQIRAKQQYLSRAVRAVNNKSGHQLSIPPDLLSSKISPDLHTKIRGLRVGIPEDFNKNKELIITAWRVVSGHYPKMQSVKIKTRIGESRITVPHFRGKLMGGNVTGRAEVLPGKFAKARIDFKDMDVGELKNKGILDNVIILGSASGRLYITRSFAKEGNAQLQGHMLLKEATLSGFPFQRDPVIKNFMPGLRKLDFDELTIVNFKYDGRKLSIRQLKGTGSKINISGWGYAVTGDSLNFTMTCNLTEQYFGTLKQLVQDGMFRDAMGRPSFKCEITGDMKDQQIILDKVFAQVMRTNITKMGKKLKSLFE